MHVRSTQLRHHSAVFRQLTGLTVPDFDGLVADLLPAFTAAEQVRLNRPTRQRARGGGRQFELPPREQILLTVIWLRQYPMHAVLGFLFGLSHPTVGRIIARILPLLEAAGRDTMRLPDPGKKQRRTLDALLHDTPELAVVIDTFEHDVQRPRDRTEADTYYSGKKKRHTLKSQITVDEQTGRVVDVSASVPGPTADLTLLQQSGVLKRLPPGVGALGDLAYVGIEPLHPHGLGATPRRKPRAKPRPVDDVAYNQAFARRRVVVEHTIGRMRCFQAVRQRDRHHRRHHTARVCAVAGLVNRRLVQGCR
jgi:hypothetical protein